MDYNKILIVEDDEQIGHVIQGELQKWHFNAQRVTDFQHVLTQFNEFQPDLVLMDIGLPYFNGYHWCSEIRKSSTVPLIFLSSADDKMNMLMAMNLGADDFISKPVDLEILIAKIQATIRRSYTFNEPVKELSYQGLHLTLLEGELRYQNQVLNLTPNEAKIMGLLFARQEKVVTKEEIMDKLWESEEFISQNTLTVTITRLRKKLSSHDFPSFIHTIKGIGYMLVIADD